MAADTKPLRYRSYLLTVWQVQDSPEAESPSWRFHLTDPHTGTRYGFTSPATLLAALQQALWDQLLRDEASPSVEDHDLRV